MLLFAEGCTKDASHWKKLVAQFVGVGTEDLALAIRVKLDDRRELWDGSDFVAAVQRALGV
jgi:hypothetical protein